MFLVEPKSGGHPEGSTKLRQLHRQAMMNGGQQGNEACQCLDADTHFCGFEKKAIGVDDQYGEVTLWTCKKCGRKWLHYFIEYEYLTAAGRMFTGVISPAALAGITAANAADAFEAMDWYFRGGSAFGSKLVRTRGALKPWLIPFPGK